MQRISGSARTVYHGFGRLAEIAQLSFRAANGSRVFCPRRATVPCMDRLRSTEFRLRRRSECLDRAVTAHPGLAGIWVLNPDAEPEADALDALVRRAAKGNKGMVGSTIIPLGERDQVHCRGGHHWRKLMTKLAIIGQRDPVNGPIDLEAIEANLDCISGASMYVTRACLDKIGPMDERFFLYYEDADWSFRAKVCGLGYASKSLVPHRGGTTIGSSGRRAKRSSLSVYLESRNRINFVGVHLRRSLPLAGIMGFLFAVEYLLAGSLQNFNAALYGLIAGLKGETGRPPNFVTDGIASPDTKNKQR